MDEGNLAILVDAKTEYTKQLINILSPNIFQGIKKLYRDARDKAKTQNSDNALGEFQLNLSEIPKWNQEIINNEYQNILQTSNCDWLEDLITAVFISHTRILTSINFSKNKNKINLKIPKVDHFIHQCYIEVARAFWKNPYLFDETVTKFDYQRNRRDAEIIIDNTINETIRKQLPVKHILKEYLGNDFTDNEPENEELSNTLNNTQKENLRKMVKTEIENCSKEKLSQLNINTLDEDTVLSELSETSLDTDTSLPETLSLDTKASPPETLSLDTKVSPPETLSLDTDTSLPEVSLPEVSSPEVSLPEVSSPEVSSLSLDSKPVETEKGVEFDEPKKELNELDDLIETELNKLDDSLNIEELNLDMDDLSSLEEVYIDKNPSLDVVNLEENKSSDIDQNIKMEINSSSENQEIETPQEKVKTIFIDTNKDTHSRREGMNKHGRKKDYNFFSDASND